MNRAMVWVTHTGKLVRLLCFFNWAARHGLRGSLLLCSVVQDLSCLTIVSPPQLRLLNQVVRTIVGACMCMQRVLSCRRIADSEQTSGSGPALSLARVRLPHPCRRSPRPFRGGATSWRAGGQLAGLQTAASVRCAVFTHVHPVPNSFISILHTNTRRGWVDDTEGIAVGVRVFERGH
jgi:hypothetical protein